MIKRIYKILNLKLNKIENSISNKDGSLKNNQQNDKFKTSLNIKVNDSNQRINDIRNSIQNIKR